MEYLDITGEVNVNANTLDEQFCRTIQSIQAIEFVDSGHIDVELDGNG